MKRIMIIPLILTVALMMVVFGCSKSTEPQTKTPGDPNDPTAAEAKMMTEGYIDSILVSFNSGIGLLGFDGSWYLAKPADTLFPVMHDDYWYELYLDSTVDNCSIVMVDSFRFEQGDSYQELPDSNTTAFEYRIRVDGECAETYESYAIHYYDAYRFTGINTEEITVNGTSASELEGSMGEVEINYSCSGQLTNVVFLTQDINYEGENYPVSGTAEVALALYISDQIGDIPAMNVNWTLVVTFNENGYHARLESDQNYWEWDVTWDAGPT